MVKHRHLVHAGWWRASLDLRVDVLASAQLRRVERETATVLNAEIEWTPTEATECPVVAASVRRVTAARAVLHKLVEGNLERRSRDTHRLA